MLVFLPLQLQKETKQHSTKEVTFCLLHEGTPSGLQALLYPPDKDYYSIHFKT